MITIRSTKTPSDWAEVRRICCETGKSGAPIERERWPFFGEFWIGPYARYCGDLAFVACLESSIVGYLVGCADTASFEAQKRFGFSLRLLARVFLGRYRRNADTRRFVRRYFGLEKPPEEFFSVSSLNELRSRYPAHLHINLDAKARGLGTGTALVGAFFSELQKRKTPGCHVFCGSDPVSFYEKQGFQIREKIEYKPGVFVFLLVRAV